MVSSFFLSLFISYFTSHAPFTVKNLHITTDLVAALARNSVSISHSVYTALKFRSIAIFKVIDEAENRPCRELVLRF